MKSSPSTAAGRSNRNSITMALVFQYGSNMSEARLNGPDRLNGNARVVGIAITEGKFDFVFDILSDKGRNAAADIVADGTRRIWGVVYDVPDALIGRQTAKPRRSLDAIEGEGGNYQRIRINLRWRNGRVIRDAVFTYVGLARRNGIQTTQGYVDHILRGLADHQMPSGYIKYIRSQIALNNPALLLPEYSRNPSASHR